MEPQTSIPPAANILGTIGTVVGAFKSFHSRPPHPRYVPQLTLRRIWRNWRQKNTDGLPGTMLMLWAVCAVPFGVYAIVQNFNISLQLQPQCFGGLTLIAWGQTLYYHNHYKAWSAALTTLLVAASFAVSEAILILTLRGPYKRGVEWPMIMMAVSASVIQALGLIAPYFELAKRSGRVIGIDFTFLTVDFAGAFFSLMALVAQHTFDWLGGSLYIVCMTLEIGIFISQGVWVWRARHVRLIAKQAGLSYDEYVAKTKLGHSESTYSVTDLEAGRIKFEETITPLEKCRTHPSEKSLDPIMAEPIPSGRRLSDPTMNLEKFEIRNPTSPRST